MNVLKRILGLLKVDASKDGAQSVMTGGGLSKESVRSVMTGGGVSKKSCCVSDTDLQTDDDVPRSEELGERCKSVSELQDPYSPAPKKTSFQRKLEAAMMPRRRRHKVRGLKKERFVRPTSNLELVLDDMATDPRKLGVDCYSSWFAPIYTRTRQSAGEVLVRAGAQIIAATAMDIGVGIKDVVLAKKRAAEREAQLAKRRKYYDAEAVKRRARAAQIRAAVPPPENPMPTAIQLLSAYRHRHDGEAEKLRFGRLMIDLDEHVHYRLLIDGNRITGNTGGVREWLVANCPELVKHYHTCQRFKRKVQEDPALAERKE